MGNSTSNGGDNSNTSSVQTKYSTKPKTTSDQNITKTATSPSTSKSLSTTSHSLFQKATVSQHHHPTNDTTTATATKRKYNHVWDYYTKLDHVAQGSTCDIFTVVRSEVQDHRSDNGTTTTKSSTTTSTQQQSTTFILKQMDKHKVSPIILQEMQSEIDILKTLDHPHVVRIYETFQDEHCVYLIMEHLKGGDLFSRHHYTESQVARIIRQICSALVYCHENHVVHRDIKMENIMFDTKEPDSDVTLIDFGLSTKYIKSPGHEKLTDRVGTMYSMSPQVLEGAYNEKADMWAVGVVAYILLTGKRPFDADTDKELAKKIYQGQYSMTGPEWQHVSPHAKTLVRQLLEYVPSQRLSAAAALRSSFLQKKKKKKHSSTDPPHHPATDPQTFNRIQQALIDSQKASQLRKFAMMVIAYRMPVEDIVELRTAFDELDEDNHGTINYREFKKVLSQSQHTRKKLPDKELKSLFQELDQNQTGVINYTEFLAATLDTRMLVERGLIRSAFDKLDLDQSGYIQPDELEEFLGHSIPRETIQDTFQQLDQDGDGKISYTEFMALFENEQETRFRAAADAVPK
ncbi:protein kinase family protein [Nitzschia inconspicua]|uniref:Protein kinase family protein n=1 Tax=Nitzschia inconspicua TaxID=303405 RepID=A0A9K3LSJ5_9STRA|nr:protein kinase family protein [Nitzschia inconspicua]